MDMHAHIHACIHVHTINFMYTLTHTYRVLMPSTGLTNSTVAKKSKYWYLQTTDTVH